MREVFIKLKTIIIIKIILSWKLVKIKCPNHKDNAGETHKVSTVSSNIRGKYISHKKFMLFIK